MTNKPTPELAPSGRATSVEGIGYLMSRVLTTQGREKGMGITLRPTDIVIAPFGKCGTTWLQQIGHTLRTRENGLGKTARHNARHQRPAISETPLAQVCSTSNVRPALRFKRSISSVPIAAAGVNMPPEAASGFLSRHTALSAIIFDVEP
jgi:hypothetical protein